MARILIVEDEPAIAESMAFVLRQHGHGAKVVATGAAALEAAAESRFDLVLLDRMLPDISGITICHRLRATSAVPIILVTALDDERERVLGLEVGADDYLGKPFSMNELVSRIRALLRRRALDTADHRIHIGWAEINTLTQRVMIEDRTVALPNAEFRMLHLLAGRAGEIISRDEAHALLADDPQNLSTRSVDVLISRLRAKLEPNPSKPIRIVTERGAGYRLVPDTQR